MAKYIKQEMNDLNGKGETKAYYRLQTTRNIDATEFVSTLCRNYKGISEGDAIRVLVSAAEHLAELLGKGYSVSIDKIGNFKATIGLELDKEMDSFEEDETKRNARSLRLTGIYYRTDKELIKKANRHCKLERTGESRLDHTPYSKEERLKLAQQYLEKHTKIEISTQELLL